jgi:hypothetical protein
MRGGHAAREFSFRLIVLLIFRIHDEEMCDPRTIMAAALLAIWPACTLAQAIGDFADCTGRYSATVEHLWMFDGLAADRAALRRDAFADLLAALPDDPGTMARRVAAKAAQRHLWDRAAFSGDLRAETLARDYLVACDSLLTGA